MDVVGSIPAGPTIKSPDQTTEASRSPAVSSAGNHGAAGELPVADSRRSPRSTQTCRSETRHECAESRPRRRARLPSARRPTADLPAETPATTGFARLPSGSVGVRIPSPQRDEQRTTYLRQRLLEAGGRGRIAERCGAGPANGRQCEVIEGSSQRRSNNDQPCRSSPYDARNGSATRSGLPGAVPSPTPVRRSAGPKFVR